MTYLQTLDYLFRKLPMYQRVGKAAYKPNLNNTLKLDRHLDYPHKKFKSIHVGGTNGKGSSSHAIASILQEAGYNVGLYTSPHLKDFRERVRVNGEKIPENYVCNFVNKHKTIFEQWNLSFFEWTVGLAFDYFKDQKVDIAVIEVGLGGRLDSTNIIKPIISLITNIGYDHQQFLGNTIERIAVEKAGIIKPNTPIIISETQTEIEDVFKEKAKTENAEIIFADQQETKSYPTDLKGNYQKTNQKGVVSVIQQLVSNGFVVNEQHIKNGLNSVVKNTNLKGRWQVLEDSPLTICDTAHNKEGLSYVLKQLTLLNKENLHGVLGFVNDKNVEEILSLFPKNAQYYLCKPKVQRGLKMETLKVIADKLKLNYSAFNSVEEALEGAKKNAKPHDVIYVGGSTFVVAEVV